MSATISLPFGLVKPDENTPVTTATEIYDEALHMYQSEINAQRGSKGEKGDPGKSAYEIAVEQGYSGTEAEWIASLKGERGERGEQGPQGIQGIQGERGERGIQGETGPQGPQGEVGPIGPAGADGRDGADGATGERGPQGIQGEQGVQGEKGEQGERGLQGDKGDKGDTGDQGPQGDKGEKGDKGDPGEPYYTRIGTTDDYTLEVGRIYNLGVIDGATITLSTTYAHDGEVPQWHFYFTAGANSPQWLVPITWKPAFEIEAGTLYEVDIQQVDGTYYGRVDGFDA